MSVERYWHWTCDKCNLTVKVLDYGLPKGWIFVKGKIITHRCEACKGEIPKRMVGIPQAIASK